VKRTLEEQVELEFNSNFKKYLDKGYKDVSEIKFDELTSECCYEMLGDTKTDQNGGIAPENRVNSVNPEMGIPSQAN
jgi:hypothetical protein